MKNFRYKALKKNKELVSGYIEAETSREVREKVLAIGFLPTEIYEEKLEPDNKNTAKTNKKIRLSLNEKMGFVAELQNLLASSISILDALESIVKYPPSKKVAIIMEDVANLIKSGSTFSDALNHYNSTFGNLFISLCKTGEESGTLPEVLDYIKVLLGKQNRLKSKYIQMSIYPIILVSAMVLLFFLAGGYIYPKLVCSLQISAVPFFAAVIMDSVSFLLHYWLILLILLGGTLYGINCVCNLSGLRNKCSEILLKIPVVNNCVQYFCLAHYMAVLHISYEAGVPITDALNMAENTINNKVLKKRASNLSRMVEEGTPITDAFEASELIPGILMPLIMTGEKSGKLGQMFRDASIAIEKKLDMALEVLARAFEPFLICIIGIGVLFLAVGMIQIYAESLSAIGSFF